MRKVLGGLVIGAALLLGTIGGAAYADDTRAVCTYTVTVHDPQGRPYEVVIVVCTNEYAEAGRQ